IAQPAVDHHADHLQRFAAIRRALAAGVAMAAVHVGLHAALVSGLHVLHALACFEHRYAQFMANHPRIAEKRHLAQKSAVVGPADAHAIRLDQHLARPWRTRLVHLDIGKMLRLVESNGSHLSYSCANAATLMWTSYPKYSLSLACSRKRRSSRPRPPWPA